MSHLAQFGLVCFVKGCIALFSLVCFDKVCIVLEVKQTQLRLQCGLSLPQYSPHITTTFMWRRIYEAHIEPFIGRSTGKVDFYAAEWSERRCGLRKLKRGVTDRGQV